MSEREFGRLMESDDAAADQRLGEARMRGRLWVLRLFGAPPSMPPDAARVPGQDLGGGWPKWAN